MTDEPEDDEGDPGWSPEDETDPGKIQRDMLNLMKDYFKKAFDDKEKPGDIFKEALNQFAPKIVGTYTHPTFEEISKYCQKCWEETKKIVPDAPEMVKIRVFDRLLYTSSETHSAGLPPPGELAI